MAEKARQVPVKISVGTGWATVETTGAALSISLPKNALKPKAVEACSISKIRELAATTIRTAPPTPRGRKSGHGPSAERARADPAVDLVMRASRGALVAWVVRVRG